MKIVDYLDRKYGVKATTMLKAEARIFGIPYPLRFGWRERVSDESITPEMHRRLVESLSRSHKVTAPDGLRVLAGHIPERPVMKDEEIRAQKKQSRAPRLKKQKLKKAHATAPRPSFNASVMGNEFLQSYEWRVLRMRALKQYGARCQCCGDTPANGAIMNVDHIKPRRLFPQLALDLSNLQVLCSACNHGKSNWDMTDWRGHEPELSADELESIRILRSL